MLGQDKLLLHMATVRYHVVLVAGRARQVYVRGCGTWKLWCDPQWGCRSFCEPVRCSSGHL